MCGETSKCFSIILITEQRILQLLFFMFSGASYFASLPQIPFYKMGIILVHPLWNCED